jgi:hypothetical protein
VALFDYRFTMQRVGEGCVKTPKGVVQCGPDSATGVGYSQPEDQGEEEESSDSSEGEGSVSVSSRDDSGSDSEAEAGSEVAMLDSAGRDRVS